MALAIVLAVFALYQRRWLPYASLTEVILVARYFQIAPLQWTRWSVALLFFVNTSVAGYTEVAVGRMQPPNQPSAELARLAGTIDQPGGILAPWWLSPGLLYFSGQPIVSGSSHCGISGIAASARVLCHDVLDRRGHHPAAAAGALGGRVG